MPEIQKTLTESVLLKRQSLLHQYQQAFPTAQKLTVSFCTPTGQEGWSQLWVLPRGATIAAWLIAWGDQIRDIILGSPNESEYALQDVYFGAVCGRVANRIKGASFELAGKTYVLEANNGLHALHGSHPGFHEKKWDFKLRKQHPGEAVLQASLFSPDGEAGYPGNLETSVRFILQGGDQLSLQLRYTAKTDQTTLCNLTNHAYFNLNGHESGSLAGHLLEIAAREITLNDECSCPTGKRVSVQNGILDFLSSKPLLPVLAERHTHPDLVGARGLDHNFILATEKRVQPDFAAQLSCSDLRLTCLTNQPGLQVYTANYLQNHLGKRTASGRSVTYPAQAGICLEAQAWPDAIHHEAEGFPSVILEEGEVYEQETKYLIDFI